MPKIVRARPPHDDGEERKIRNPKKVPRWLHRFNAVGPDGLGDRPGAGRRRRITEAQRSQIIALARSAPPGRLERHRPSAGSAR